MLHPTSTKLNRIIFAPVISFCHFLGRHNPELLLQLRYYFVFHKKLNLRNPLDLNEKIIWAKLYSDTSRWTELADKYKVRKYIEDMGLGDVLVKIYGAWEDAEQFDFSVMPEKYILKANNGDGKGTNYVVKNNSRLTEREKTFIKSKIKEWLSRKNIGLLHAEPQYKDIKPMVIAEELLPQPSEGKSLVDYKVWCFNGKAHYIWTCSERSASGSSAQVMTYDLDWDPHPEYSVFNSDYPKGKPLPKPKNLSKMIEIAEKLSKGFPELRVDLYNIEPDKADGRIYFGELTFTSHGGFMGYFTQDFLELTGKLFSIEDFPIKQG